MHKRSPHKRSLQAMGHACRCCKFGARTLAEVIQGACRRWQLGASSLPERVTSVAVYIYLGYMKNDL